MIVRKNTKSGIKSKAIRSLPEIRRKRHLSFYSSIVRDIRDIEMRLYRIKKALKYYSEDSVEQNDNEVDDLDGKMEQVIGAYDEVLELVTGDNVQTVNNSKRGFYKKIYYSSQSVSILNEIKNDLKQLGEAADKIKEQFESPDSSETREFALKINVFGVLDSTIEKTVKYANVSSQELEEILKGKEEGKTVQVKTLDLRAKIAYFFSGLSTLPVAYIFIKFGWLIEKLGTGAVLSTALKALAIKLAWIAVAFVVLAIIALVIAIAIQSANKEKIKKKFDTYKAKASIIYTLIKQKLMSRDKAERQKAYEAIKELRATRKLIESQLSGKQQNKEGEIVLNTKEAESLLNDSYGRLDEIKKLLS